MLVRSAPKRNAEHHGQAKRGRHMCRPLLLHPCQLGRKHLTNEFHLTSKCMQELGMRPDTHNGIWSDFWEWVEQIGEALAYEPIEDLEARVARLENEIRLLRAR